MAEQAANATLDAVTAAYVSSQSDDYRKLFIRFRPYLTQLRTAYNYLTNALTYGTYASSEFAWDTKQHAIFIGEVRKLTTGPQRANIYISSPFFGLAPVYLFNHGVSIQSADFARLCVALNMISPMFTPMITTSNQNAHILTVNGDKTSRFALQIYFAYILFTIARQEWINTVQPSLNFAGWFNGDLAVTMEAVTAFTSMMNVRGRNDEISTSKVIFICVQVLTKSLGATYDNTAIIALTIFLISRKKEPYEIMMELCNQIATDESQRNLNRHVFEWAHYLGQFTAELHETDPGLMQDKYKLGFLMDLAANEQPHQRVDQIIRALPSDQKNYYFILEENGSIVWRNDNQAAQTYNLPLGSDVRDLFNSLSSSFKTGDTSIESFVKTMIPYQSASIVPGHPFPGSNPAAEPTQNPAPITAPNPGVIPPPSVAPTSSTTPLTSVFPSTDQPPIASDISSGGADVPITGEPSSTSFGEPGATPLSFGDPNANRAAFAEQATGPDILYRQHDAELAEAERQQQKLKEEIAQLLAERQGIEADTRRDMERRLVDDRLAVLQEREAFWQTKIKDMQATKDSEAKKTELEVSRNVSLQAQLVELQNKFVSNEQKNAALALETQRVQQEIIMAKDKMNMENLHQQQKLLQELIKLKDESSINEQRLRMDMDQVRQQMTVANAEADQRAQQEKNKMALQIQELQGKLDVNRQAQMEAEKLASTLEANAKKELELIQKQADIDKQRELEAVRAAEKAKEEELKKKNEAERKDFAEKEAAYKLERDKLVDQANKLNTLLDSRKQSILMETLNLSREDLLNPTAQKMLSTGEQTVAELMVTTPTLQSVGEMVRRKFMTQEQAMRHLWDPLARSVLTEDNPEEGAHFITEQDMANKTLRQLIEQIGKEDPRYKKLEKLKNDLQVYLANYSNLKDQSETAKISPEIAAIMSKSLSENTFAGLYNEFQTSDARKNAFHNEMKKNMSTIIQDLMQAKELNTDEGRVLQDFYNTFLAQSARAAALERALPDGVGLKALQDAGWGPTAYMGGVTPNAALGRSEVIQDLLKYGNLSPNDKNNLIRGMPLPTTTLNLALRAAMAAKGTPIGGGTAPAALTDILGGGTSGTASEGIPGAAAKVELVRALDVLRTVRAVLDQEKKLEAELANDPKQTAVSIMRERLARKPVEKKLDEKDLEIQRLRAELEERKKMIQKTLLVDREVDRKTGYRDTDGEEKKIKKIKNEYDGDQIVADLNTRQLVKSQHNPFANFM